MEGQESAAGGGLEEPAVADDEDDHEDAEDAEQEGADDAEHAEDAEDAEQEGAADAERAEDANETEQEGAMEDSEVALVLERPHRPAPVAQEVTEDDNVEPEAEAPADAAQAEDAALAEDAAQAEDAAGAEGGEARRPSVPAPFLPAFAWTRMFGCEGDRVHARVWANAGVVSAHGVGADAGEGEACLDPRRRRPKLHALRDQGSTAASLYAQAPWQYCGFSAGGGRAFNF